MSRQLTLWLRDKLIRSRSLNATRIVAASFAVIILTGALLLTLPAASRSGESAGFSPLCLPLPRPPVSPD